MVNPTTRECDIHLVPLADGADCAYCLRFLRTAPPADDLPAAVKLDELEQWLTARPSVPMEMLYERIEALVGRSISMHELDDPDLLLRRAQRPRRRSMDWDDW